MKSLEQISGDDKKLIRYDGMYELACIGLEDAVAYTSIKTKSSGVISKQAFKQYKQYSYNIYFRSDVLANKEDKEEYKR